MTLKWNGPAIMQMIRKRVHNAAAHLMRKLFDQIIISISVQGPPRSQPGEPPHMDTTKLVTTFVFEYIEEQLVYRISSPEEYSIMLEIGTSRMAARPFATPAIQDARANAVSWLKEGMDIEAVPSGYNVSMM